MKKTKVFSDAYQATITIYNRTRSYPKPYRPTLGRRFEESILNVLLALRKANTCGGERRLKHLRIASENLDDTRVLAQLSRDMQILPVSALSEIAALTQEIGREIGGFIKYENSKR